MGAEDVGNGTGKAERIGKYRGRRDPLGGDVTGHDLGGGDGGVPGLELVGAPAQGLPTLETNGLDEPVYPSSGWPERPEESLIEHPLLRGLLLELPPRDRTPAPEWLDRWFEATRAILELLYVQERAVLR